MTKPCGECSCCSAMIEVIQALETQCDRARENFDQLLVTAQRQQRNNSQTLGMLRALSSAVFVELDPESRRRVELTAAHLMEA